MDRVDAQQARRVVDRLIGYPVSTLLWAERFAAGCRPGASSRSPCAWSSIASARSWRSSRSSTGRCKPSCRDAPAERRPTLHRQPGRARRREDRAAHRASRRRRPGRAGGRGLVAWPSVREREQQRHPDAPFTTSTLQQEASRKLGFTATPHDGRRPAVVRRHRIGGGEAVGLITYMRTDSVNVAQEAQDEAREYIRDQARPTACCRPQPRTLPHAQQARPGGARGDSADVGLPRAGRVEGAPQLTSSSGSTT